MRILFLEPRLSIEGDPMGVMQLSALARKQGHETDLVQLSRGVLDEIAARRPDLLAVSMMSTEFVRLRRAMAKVRERFPKLKILVGGPHPTFVPSCLDDLAADAICVGEGDHAFLDVLARSQAGADWDGIPNIQTRTSRNPPRPLVEDLDSLPFPDREIVYRNSRAVRSFKLRSFLATRGCPFQCTYCFNHAYNRMYKGLGRVVRKRSVDNLIEEVAQVARTYPTQFVKFADDSFVLRVDDWLVEFAAKYKKRIGLPFYCLVRADVVTEDMVRLLKEAGCASVCMSIETGNARIRKEILHRNVDDAQLARAFDLFNAAGVRIYTNNMLGLPGAGLAEELETLDLNIRCRPAYGHFTIMVPFPGTRMFEHCVHTGDVDSRFSIEDLSESTGAMSMLKSFTPEQKRLQKNLSLLGPTVIHWPRLRSLVVGRLIRWRPNAFFSLVHFLTKNYLFKKHIVPISLSPWEYLVLGLSQLAAEIRMIRDRKGEAGIEGAAAGRRQGE